MDKLDQLLTAHVGLSIEDEAARFLSLDVSGIEYNEAIKQKILNLGGRPRRYRSKHATAKLILVAALLALSLVFTACMAIPEIRAALWRIVIDPHEDHIAIRFEQETSKTTSAATELTTTPPILTATEPTAEQTAAVPSYPQTLKQWAYATYLPTGYTQVSENYSQFSRMVEYRNSADQMLFGLTQLVISDDEWMLDYEEGDILSYIRINGFPAAMIEYPDDPACYSLTWQSDQYTYNLLGYVPSEAELIKIAESIVLKDIPATAAQTTVAQASSAAPRTTVIEATPTPPNTIEQIAYIDHLPDGWYSEPSVITLSGAVTNYLDTTGNRKFVLSQVLLSGTNRFDSENVTITQTAVLGYPALLMQDTEEQGSYTLTWTDGLYNYTLYGLFDSVSRLMDFAEAVKLS